MSLRPAREITLTKSLKCRILTSKFATERRDTPDRRAETHGRFRDANKEWLARILSGRPFSSKRLWIWSKFLCYGLGSFGKPFEAFPSRSAFDLDQAGKRRRNGAALSNRDLCPG